jgi:hypothetical protein
VSIIFLTQGDEAGTFGIVVVMNVAFFGIMLLMKGFDMFLKWGLLRGASKSARTARLPRRRGSRCSAKGAWP